MRRGRRGLATQRPEAAEPSTKKSYVTILDEEIEEAVNELERPAGGLLLSGLSAGLDLGFSVLILAVLRTSTEGSLPAPILGILEANAYAVGFVLVIFGRSELFTEHVTMAVLPVLDRRAPVARLFRLWGLVYASNLAGAGAFAALLAVIGPGLGITSAETLGKIAVEVVAAEPWWILFLSGVLAGWMMGLASWLVTAGRDTTSEILFVWLVTGAIGYTHLHHCIVGTIEVLAGMFAGGPVTTTGLLYFLSLATAGNVVGGVFFVAVLKYGHATQIRPGMRH